MRRYQIIPIVILSVVLLAFGAVYQFYIKDRRDEFRQNEQRREQLAVRLQGLASTFAGVDGRPVKPEEAVKQYRLAVQPWVDKLKGLSSIYKMEDEFDFEPVPENMIPKFHYRDEFLKMGDDLWNYAAEKQVDISTIDTTFGVVVPESLEGKNPTSADVNGWLEDYAANIALAKQAIDSGAWVVRSIVVWPPREEVQLLELHTVGYELDIQLRDLITFLRSFYEREEYVSIDALRIMNPDLLAPSEPLLTVQLLITQARFKDDAKAPWEATEGGGGAGGDAQELLMLQQRAGGGFGFAGIGSGDREEEEVPSWRRWLRVILPI